MALITIELVIQVPVSC